MSLPSRFKLVFFSPPAALPAVKTAIFAAGAGRYPGPGSYTECGFTTAGKGQFRPGASANPHIGTSGQLEEVDELRFETLCVGLDVVKQAVEALKRSVALLSSHASRNLQVSADVVDLTLMISPAEPILMRRYLSKCTRWKTFDYTCCLSRVFFLLKLYFC